MKHGLTKEMLVEIRGVLSDCPEVEQAVLYGSRAKGAHRPGSDIDLALVGEDLGERTVSRIAGEFDDGWLPHRVDLSILGKIRHAALLDHIRRVGIVLYEKEFAAAKK